MLEYEEHNRNRLVDYDPQVAFPLKLIALILIGGIFYLADYGLTLRGVFP